MKATTKDLRLHTAEVLAATDRGEEVIITYHGKQRARLTGMEWDSSKTAVPCRNPAFGLWHDRGEDVNEQVRRLRAPRSSP